MHREDLKLVIRSVLEGIYAEDETGVRSRESRTRYPLRITSNGQLQVNRLENWRSDELLSIMTGECVRQAENEDNGGNP